MPAQWLRCAHRSSFVPSNARVNARALTAPEALSRSDIDDTLVDGDDARRGGAAGRGSLLLLLASAIEWSE